MVSQDRLLDLVYAGTRHVDHEQQLSRREGLLESIQLVIVLLAAEQCGYEGAETGTRHRPGDQRSAANDDSCRREGNRDEATEQTRCTAETTTPDRR